MRAAPTRTVNPWSLRFRHVTPVARRKMHRRLFLSPSSFTVPPRMYSHVPYGAFGAPAGGSPHRFLRTTVRPRDRSV